MKKENLERVEESAAPKVKLPLCDTTMTPRLPTTYCIDYQWGEGCGTYRGNLGPCEKFEEGMNGRCVYCDHRELCHPTINPMERIRGKE